MPPKRVIMFHSSERPRLTFEPGFQILSEIRVPTAEEEEEEETASISSCSFTFSYPSTSPISSPMIPGTPEKELEPQQEEEQKQQEQQEQQDQQDQQEEEEQEQQEEQMEQEQQEEQELAAVTLGPPRCPQSSSSSSWSTSDGSSSSQEEDDTHSLQAPADTKSLPRNLLNEKVADLVNFMILKYRLKEPITKAEMLKVVIKRYKKQFPVIFKKACKCLEVISGIDVKEVDPQIHSYVLVNSLDLTHVETLSDNQSMPKNGLLIIILGLIFIEGNCTPEENIWDFLSMIGVYAGREHFIYGEPRKLLTRDWVQQNYLVYQKVPNSDPPRYEFLWGPRAHAETSKMKVLEFLAKIKGTDPITFSCWWEEALRDERESGPE
ncbi:melanoma-associated antigen 9 [Camelus ferus]|uniref:Melanoma-associated antigen 9 n=2 Tax=Camelus TaxID=9836 RepID=A0A8B8SLY3_CAMFR|nr:melanoma-associated antigen 9 [Camelus ferus]XP_032330407.1 melanoma-associated antigen 9 [Camelus ferus]XP_045370845.1 melanoma-associated antigen 9-like [Camelus bactrianus]